MLSAPAAPATRSIRLKPRLKEAREEKGLSQARLGRLITEKLGEPFRPNHVGLFELGYRDATWSEVEALSHALDVDPHWLAGRELSVTAAPGASLPVGAGLARAQEQSSGAAVSASGAETPVPSGGAPAAAPGGEATRLPPATIPPRNATVEVVYREQLGQLLNKANQTLLDRTLRPAEWRAWREYAERLKAALRAL